MTTIISIANHQNYPATNRSNNAVPNTATLEEAVSNGSLVQVKRLINKPIHMRDYRAALSSAASNGRIHILRTLMESKAGSVKLKTLLKRAGCTCCECTHKGVIPASIYHDLITDAATSGRLAVVKYLVKQRADVEFIYEHASRSNYKDGDILEKAAANGQIDVVKYLNEYYTEDTDTGVYINSLVYDRGQAALNKASTYGHLKVVQYLIQFVEENHPGTATATLMRAASSGHLEILKFLGQFGYRTDADDSEALVAAVKGKNLEIVKYLLARGINFDNSNGDALIAAVNNVSLPIVKLLVDHGANVGAQNGAPLKAALENSDLRVVISEGDLEMMKYLIEHGADEYIDDAQLETIKDKLRHYCGEKWLTIIRQPLQASQQPQEHNTTIKLLAKSPWWSRLPWLPGRKNATK